MTGLVAFLNARLNEDEHPGWVERRCDGCGQRIATRGAAGLAYCTTCQPADLPFVGERWLREVAFKRAILAAHAPDYLSRYGSPGPPQCKACISDRAGYEEHWEGDDWPCLDVRSLLALYSDHPDYDPAWADVPGSEGSAGRPS